VGVGLLAALVYAVGLARPSPWRDEVATIDAVRRSPAGILSLTSHVDAVHAAYYLLAHGVADLDPGPVRVLDGRLVSLVAMAVAAGGTVVLGRRTDRTLAGVLAGVFVALSPLASRYAAEARPFALATALAVVATLALLAALDFPGGRRAALFRWGLYGLALAALGAVEVLALLLVAVHLLVVLTRPSMRPNGKETGWRGALPGWLLAGAGAAVVLAPLVVVVVRQRGQINALGTPSPVALAAFGGRAVGSVVGVAVLAVVAAVVLVRAVSALRAGRGRSAVDRATPPSWRAPLRARMLSVAGWLVPVTWGVGLPVLLWVVSQADPLFRERYVLFTLPGIALLVGRVLARVPVAIAWVALLAVAGAGLPTQAAIRGPGGHGEDIRALDTAVAAQRQPGDVAVFTPRSTTRVTQLDPPVWAGLRAVTTTAVLSGVPRVLVVRHVTAGSGGADAPTDANGLADAAVQRALAAGFRATTTTEVTGFRLTVYVRRTAAGQ